MAAVSTDEQKKEAGDRSKLGFRQFFDRDSCTYTYLLWDIDTKEAVLIDPVDTKVNRDLQFISEIGELKLLFCINTHLHADHITGSGLIQQKTNAKSVIGNFVNVDEEKELKYPKADVLLNEQKNTVTFGQFTLIALHTPGHTQNHVCYYLSDKSMVFTGDALLVRKCGRCDFQGGSINQLWKSVTGRSEDDTDASKIENKNGLFQLLPLNCIVYPGHDYDGRLQSTIAEEKQYNERLKDTNTFNDFKSIMTKLHNELSKPGKMDVCVPANRRCGYETELNPIAKKKE